jgi:hypothetical protein
MSVRASVCQFFEGCADRRGSLRSAWWRVYAVFGAFLVAWSLQWVIEAARRSANCGAPSGATKIIAAYALFHWEKRLNRLHFEALKSLKSVQKGP